MQNFKHLDKNILIDAALILFILAIATAFKIYNMS